jgi:hypothetical protein
MAKLAMGMEVKDKITGLSGVVIGESQWLNGCERLTVQPSALNAGKMIDAVTFDIGQLERVSKDGPVSVPDLVRTTGIEMGMQVRDKITGFQGIVVGQSRWLSGSHRFTVQPTELKDGKIAEAETLDEGRLTVMQAVTALTVPKATQSDRPGGPGDAPQRDDVPKQYC